MPKVATFESPKLTGSCKQTRKRGSMFNLATKDFEVCSDTLLKQLMQVEEERNLCETQKINCK